MTKSEFLEKCEQEFNAFPDAVDLFMIVLSSAEYGSGSTHGNLTDATGRRIIEALEETVGRIVGAIEKKYLNQ